MKHIILGILLILATIWGGSYAMSLLSESDWQRAPSGATMLTLIGLGWVIALYGFVYGGKK